MSIITNPFRPGAGHQPPYLAGRIEEAQEFEKLLDQHIVLKNMVITGLRGIGKTVLLESLKPAAKKKNWLWAGTDCSESASVTEDTMAQRLLTDVALITSSIKVAERTKDPMGFGTAGRKIEGVYLDYDFLTAYYAATPGLPSDKLKATLLLVWSCIEPLGIKGIVFAYDEAQTLSDHAEDKQYPLSVLLDVFQYLQKCEVPFLLVLTGLPTLLVRLIETRTYTERLFRVITLRQLSKAESRDAILKPINDSKHPVKFGEESVNLIIEQSGGYPFFIQFLCREVYDIFEQQMLNKEHLSVPLNALLKKLDNDFFAGRWARTTEREKELLTMIAMADLSEFGIQQIVKLSETGDIKSFSKSQLSQMFARLIENGLLYKDRPGVYSFAVPLLERYIKRINNGQLATGTSL